MALVSLGFIALLRGGRARRAAGRAARRRPRARTCRTRTRLDAFGSPLGPSAAHPFGVDQLGRDVFARVVYGARVSLEVGVIGTAIADRDRHRRRPARRLLPRLTDTLLSRTIDVVLCFPVLLVGLGLGAACGVRGCVKGAIQPGVSTIVAIVALFNWTYIARIVRGQVLSLREQEFVEAARSLGASNARIVFREILPNLAAPLIVYASLLIPAEHPARGRALVPRRRRARADGQLGADARRRHPDLQHRVVVHAVPRACAAAHRARFQPARRRPAGRSQPATGPFDQVTHHEEETTSHVQ